MQYSEQEISEAAQFCVAALLRLNNDEFISQFINKLGTHPHVMPNAHYQAVYAAILKVQQSDNPINALTVWESLEDNTKFQGGIQEMMKLHTLIVESESADIFTNYFLYTETLADHHRHLQNRQRASRISQAADLDSVILEEADRIIAKQQAKEPDAAETEKYVPFPEDLLFDVFKPYAAAFQGRTEVPIPFHFAVLKTLIGASLGRRVYLDAARPIYPNFYTVIVGETGIARKSTALRLGEQLLRDSDPAVRILRSLSTPEGLLQKFVPPHGYELGSSIPNDDIEDPDKINEQMEFMLNNATPGVEGFRILLSLDEFSYLLKKANKSHGEGIIQMLTEAYDYPTQLDLPTRVNPVSADHPCLSVMGATTQAWLESSLKLEDIQGGFANRFSYYHATSNDFIFKSQPGNPEFLDIVKYSVNQYRQKFPQPTAFQFNQDADREGEAWYIEHRNKLKAERNPLIREALARADVHMYKSALLHAVITNDANDTEIGIESLRWAIQLAEYLQAVTSQIYATFNLSEERRLEQRIIDLLTQKPNQTARQLTQRISWASAKEVNNTLDELSKNATIQAEKDGRTTRYHVNIEL